MIQINYNIIKIMKKQKRNYPANGTHSENFTMLGDVQRTDPSSQQDVELELGLKDFNSKARSRQGQGTEEGGGYTRQFISNSIPYES